MKFPFEDDCKAQIFQPLLAIQEFIMNNLSPIHYPLVAMNDGQAVTTSLAIANGTEVEHKGVIQLIRTYLVDLQEFGRVTFEMRPFETAGGQQRREIALLNEQQATLLLTYMRNSQIVRGFKKRLVKAFWDLARQAASPFAIPQTLSEALRLAADLSDKNLALAARIEEDAPKVEFHDEVVADGYSTFTLRESAKILGLKESDLRHLAQVRRLIFKNPHDHWEPFADVVRRGWMVLKIENINGRVIHWPAVTAKGLIMIRNLLATGDLLKHTPETLEPSCPLH
ncbi:putative phage-encoded protein [Gammaproteobacteria bacterium]